MVKVFTLILCLVFAFGCANRKQQKALQIPIAVAVKGDTAVKNITLPELYQLSPGESIVFGAISKDVVNHQDKLTTSTGKSKRLKPVQKQAISGLITKKSDGSLDVIATTPTLVVHDTITVKADCPVCPNASNTTFGINSYWWLAAGILLGIFLIYRITKT